ncbi:hypothetical protein A2707_02930 [Candidatus Saccharibacteria bacterium RIFCSPHIGHO2_01_FULL_45_15]|nr:MAG: hypothetical protein A2707_02930 [Candidatus Saccharibacteria bacterium RIFCSPHIGHO2_01_FULL_45_15]OGL27067.1 MAG: hypothetical protein A3C39_00780 [Candidatus Saccharibacteria bacterium RIFCSPHIGHO2_02_FULL_46_12]OGL31877.1 MAG: hypothetical protein A3E76_03525 [Candidatus Saccharibacteria bacterium RIFCSPHIGHO2_12_FULL_44_22]
MKLTVFTRLLPTDRFSLLLIVGIVLLVIARLISVVTSPPGFFLDEAAGAAHAISLLHTGANAHDVALPLYSESLGGGYTTPIYLYPLVSWIAVFGTSELAIRYFSVICGLLAIALMSFAINIWLTKRDALIAAVVALALPWGWLQSNLAWDPALVPLFVAGAFAAFTVALHDTSKTTRSVMLVMLSLFLIGLAYLYPPARVTAPLLFIGGYAVLWKQSTVSARTVFITCLVSIVIALPLAQFMLQPEALERSAALSVFHDTSILNGLLLFAVNILQLLNPAFLFVTGDPNLRHATGSQGVLGIAAIPAVIALITAFIYWLRHRKTSTLFSGKERALLAISGFGILAAFIGSALTNEGQPHSLRACAAWLFIVILLTIGWRLIMARSTRRLVRWVAVGIAIVATCAYVADLVLFYPDRSASSFDVSQRQRINDNQPTPGYPDLARKYYEIR